MDLGDPCTYVHQQECYDWDHDKGGECHQVGDIQLYVRLIYLLYNYGTSGTVTEKQKELVGIKLAITSLKRNHLQKQHKKDKNKYASTPTMMRNL